MNEYQFDPITGAPVPKPEEATPERPVPADPAPEVTEPADPVQAEPAEEVPVVEPAAPEVSIPEVEMPDDAGVRPTAEQPFYHAARPADNGYTGFNTPSGFRFEAPSAQSMPPQPPMKREPKPVTVRTFYAALAIVTVLALVLGLGGGYFGARYLSGGTVTGTAVIYKTAKLQTADGETAQNALAVPEVAELVKNSVVEITTEAIVTGSFMQQYVSQGAGSGVIITADGYIVTNHHVIEGATNISVRLADGTEYEAKLIASDSKADLAVVKVEATGLTPAAMGSSADLQVGETVIAVGNPLGQLGGTVTRGIISALDRAITIDNTTMTLLQTDTAINPGNSGGGMFNTSGQLVGIVNAKSAGEEIEGLGFAIPIDTAQSVIEDLIQHGYVTGRVNSGITFLEINDALTAMQYRVSQMGLYIWSVESGSDGEKAGFRSGDYVVSIDGTAVSTTAEANALIDSKKVGDSVTVVIRRGKEDQTLSMQLTEYIPAMGSTTTNTNTGFGGLFGRN